MLRNDIYDQSEPWKTYHEKEFKKLPQAAQMSIKYMQYRIQVEVEKAVIAQFGEEALRDLEKTSGWRGFKGNKLCGGKSNSGHLLGCCSDYGRKGIFRNKFIKSTDVLQVVPSKGWHVRLKK